MFGWSKHPSPRRIQGVLARGDQSQPPTRWWNHLYLLLFSWHQVTVFSVPHEAAKTGYLVGYKVNGVAMVCNKVWHNEHFCVRNGREDCVFFVVSANGKEIKDLKLTVQGDKSDPDFRDYPLI